MVLTTANHSRLLQEGELPTPALGTLARRLCGGKPLTNGKLTDGQTPALRAVGAARSWLKA